MEDRGRGLDGGGDDYLTNPVSLAQLIARLRALLRCQRSQEVNAVRVGDWELDLVNRYAKRGGERIELTRRNSALLEFLMNSSPKPVS